jgi:hypothetical protein
VKRESRRVVIGVEADQLELQSWGRAAALRRQELPAWIKRSLNETAQRDASSDAPRCRVAKPFADPVLSLEYFPVRAIRKAPDAVARRVREHQERR